MTHYSVVDGETGEVLGQRIPEYTSMSLKPAIGKEWAEKFLTDVYPSDSVIINGRAMQPPKYYDKVLEVNNPYELDFVKDARTRKARERGSLSWERLEVLERSRKLKIGMLPRSVE